MGITDYDTFFTDLEERIKRSPSKRKRIIRKAIEETDCPYLRGKINQLHRIYSALILSMAITSGFSSYGQTAYVALDGHNNKPVPGATVQVQRGSESAMLITDEEGQFVIPFAPPYRLLINHLAYQAHADSITDSAQKSFYLSPATQNLTEVVVTGQFEPQSARQSVYKVRTIDARRIEAQAATNLQDVLSNELNIRFSRDNAVGSSRLNLQGLSGQNIKILVDGVPMVGRSGTANEIDLGQINVQSIDRIEIVEGPLAVNYGADALAGVINVITKKDRSGFQANVLVQEETIGSEYSLFDDGIHNASLQIGGALGDHWYISGEGRINKYGGWTGNGDSRNKSWYPKDQFFGGGLMRYSEGRFDMYYRVDHMDEIIQNLGAVQHNNPLKDPYAIDEEYRSDRWMHQLQGNYKWSPFTLNSVFSYTDYQRDTRQFSTNLATSQETTTVPDEQDTIYYQSFFQRQTLSTSNPFVLGHIDVNAQIGLDTDLETAGGSTLSQGDKHQSNVGFFGSVEAAWDRLKVRPGVRFSYNSIFRTSPTASVNFKYDWSERFATRIGYGRGFRVPSIRELYHEFIDANHNIVGNSDLEPEYSHNVNADLAYRLKTLELEFSGFYNHIDNQITYFTPSEANQPTSYVNLLVYKTTGGTLQATYEITNLTVRTGFSYIGRYQRLAKSAEEVPEFVFAPNANLNVQYALPKDWQVAAFYKFTGASKSYQLTAQDEGEDQPQLQKVNAYNFLDLTISKKIKDLSIGAGVRNLLDVTSVSNNISGGGPHSSNDSGQTPIAYGRSYFLRLNYHFIKQ